jgi:hypothetical protein
VRGVLAFVFGGDLAHFDQFFGFGEKCRGINKGGRDAQRPGLHLSSYQFAHLVELCRCRLLVFQTNHMLTNGRRSDERGDVLRDSAFLEKGEIFSQRRPFDLKSGVTPAFTKALLHLIVERPHGKLAEYLGSNSLFNLAHGSWIDDQRPFRVREHVDKARRHGETFSILNRCCCGSTQVADGCDAVASDSYIGPPRWATTAVIDSAALNNDVE